MGRLKNFAVASGMSASVWAFSAGVAEFDSTVEDLNKPYVECAVYLGETAITTTDLPDACYELSGNFDQKIVTREVVEAGQARDPSPVSITTYTLPPKAEFLDANLTTQEAYEADKKSDRNLAKIIAGGLFLGVIIIMSLDDRKRAQRASVVNHA